MVRTTGEDVTFRVFVVEEVTEDDEFTFEAIEVLEIRKCDGVIRVAGVGAFVVVTRRTIVYDGNNGLDLHSYQSLISAYITYGLSAGVRPISRI